jgi:phage N-6-adenine-methyltransferase
MPRRSSDGRGGTYHERAASTGGPGGNGITEWPTPQWLVDELTAEFGPFELDPAATEENAKAPAWFGEADDGLAQHWPGVVWLNPPYGKTATPRWLAKARDEVDHGCAKRVVCLVPARVGTWWWRECEADPAVFVRVYGRVRWDPVGRGEAPFDSAVIVFGAVDGRHGRHPVVCANPACLLPYRRFWSARSDARTCSPACRKAVSRSRLQAVSVTTSTSTQAARTGESR